MLERSLQTWAGLGGGDGYFQSLVAGAKDVPDSLRADLGHGARVAAEAYAELAGFLRAELAPKARSKDAAGEDAYRLWSRYFVGAALDPHEAYAWGWEEFSRLETEMRQVAARISPGATLAETAMVDVLLPIFKQVDRDGLFVRAQPAGERDEILAAMDADFADRTRQPDSALMLHQCVGNDGRGFIKPSIDIIDM